MEGQTLIMKTTIAYINREAHNGNEEAKKFAKDFTDNYDLVDKGDYLIANDKIKEEKDGEITEILES